VTQVLLIVCILLLLACLALLVLVLRRASGQGAADVTPQLDARLELIEAGQERASAALRDELARARTESLDHARLLREEVGSSGRNQSETMSRTMREFTQQHATQMDAFSARLSELNVQSAEAARLMREDVTRTIRGFTEQSLTQAGETGKTQQERLDSFSQRIAQMHEAGEKSLTQIREEGRAATKEMRAEITGSLKAFEETVRQKLEEHAAQHAEKMQELTGRINTTVEAGEKRFDGIRVMVEQRLKEIQEDNTRKLDQMRQTVDEKLEGTLEKRLGESFKLVSDRLEQVHKGLGEMQTLASGVGDLKKVLSNVRTRGTWGEVQLGNLLEQILTREQFDRNVATRPDSGERVEFAVRLPGREGDWEKPVWLPIDAKFPQEDYLRILEASERGDADGVRDASKQLEERLIASAKTIGAKYLAPPHTTDFAILFLPTEGLFAEALRMTGLSETLQGHRVMIAGPTTLAALLNSLQMGFRTLAIEQRSSEVWSVLGAVKSEFTKFGDVFAKVKKKLSEASNTINDAEVRTRAMQRTLKSVDGLPAPRASGLLGLPEPAGPADSPEPTEPSVTNDE
jgi:DNA recombination protein RmuC